MARRRGVCRLTRRRRSIAHRRFRLSVNCHRSGYRSIHSVTVIAHRPGAGHRRAGRRAGRPGLAGPGPPGLGRTGPGHRAGHRRARAGARRPGVSGAIPGTGPGRPAGRAGPAGTAGSGRRPGTAGRASGPGWLLLRCLGTAGQPLLGPGQATAPLDYYLFRPFAAGLLITPGIIILRPAISFCLDAGFCRCFARHLPGRWAGWICARSRRDAGDRSLAAGFAQAWPLPPGAGPGWAAELPGA